MKTLIPKNIIAGCQDFPRASVRLVIFVAVGGLNPEHPWYPHAARITVSAARCIYNDLTASVPAEFVAVTARDVLQHLYEMGILDNVEFFKEGYVAYQSQAWFGAHRAELEDPARTLALVQFDAEASMWKRSEIVQPDET